MSTLAEIEAAIEKLPAHEQSELFTFLSRKLKKPVTNTPAQGDPFDAVIGVFAGPREATGRNAEDILYGSNA